MSQATTLGPQPLLSIVVPMLNEADHIEVCIQGFADQTATVDSYEVIVVDGGSNDGSREVVEALAIERPWLRVLDNPKRKIPIACNIGLRAAAGDIVCFFSSHGVPDCSFVNAVITAIEETGATGVGGRYRHVGLDPESSAIGLAMASPFGMGSAHRFSTEVRTVDTISHPAYRRDAVLDIGGFDETLERNEDYELNWRLRERGAVLMFHPAISSIYRPRATLGRAARQWFAYGQWKAEVIRMHPRSTRPRHLLPPAGVVAGAITVLAAPTRNGRRFLAIGATAYVAMVIAALRRERPWKHGASTKTFVVALPLLHVSWGSGVLAGAVRSPRRR